jgi:hypothetical protein
VLRGLVLLLLAWPAAAAPVVRWVDKLGNVHRDEIREVLAESSREVTVRRPGGKSVTLQVLRILWLTREREEHVEERALLRAREDVAAGLRLDEARPVLDRIARSGEQPWMREYAAGARALLAEKAGEKDASARLDAFLEEYEASRFVGAMHLARARLRARGGEDLLEVFAQAHEKISELGGPLLVQFQTFVEAARFILEEEPRALAMYLDSVSLGIDREIEEETDIAIHVVAKSCQVWARLLQQDYLARDVIGRGRKPHGALVELRRLAGYSKYWLPELRSDVHRQLGVVLAVCGERASAEAELRRARELAPDRNRREAVEREFERLK